MTPENKYYDVVISGAGPTGLLLANILQHFGINFLIVDKKSAPTIESRALAVQSRSMEIYQQLGLSDEIERDGQKAIGFTFLKNAKEISTAEFLDKGAEFSPFPFAMIYEQSKNESLLYNRLLSTGNNVDWNKGVESYERSSDGYIIKLKDLNGELSNVKCKYICACDGNRSIIREISGMPFTGGTYENVFFVADTHAKTGTSHSNLLLFLSKYSINLFFPMQGENRYRILGILPKEYYHHNEIKFEEIAGHLKKDENIPFDFYNTAWYSTYRLHHKKVKRFNAGNVFFSGDAAHVHSPAGGQGMNTGLQDTYNLSWKLAYVIKGFARPELLETYHNERNPIAEDLLKTTDRMFTVMTKPGSFYSFLRLSILPTLFPLLTRSDLVQKLLFKFVSQIKINYRSSDLSEGKAGKVKAGVRFPWFNYVENGERLSIYEMIRDRSLLNFTLIKFNVSQNIVENKFYNVIEIEKNTTNVETLKKKGFSDSWMALVRPDNYICYIDETGNVGKMHGHLKKYFIL